VSGSDRGHIHTQEYLPVANPNTILTLTLTLTLGLILDNAQVVELR